MAKKTYYKIGDDIYDHINNLSRTHRHRAAIKEEKEGKAIFKKTTLKKLPALLGIITEDPDNN